MRRSKDQNRTSQPADRNDSAALPENTQEDRTEQAAAPPILDPDAFLEYEGLRETTLALFTDAKANTTLRNMVDFVYTISLEYSRYWPHEPEGYFRHRCRAAIADLRHLQGYMADLGQMRFDSCHSDGDDRIAALCGRLSPRVKKIADALERALLPSPENE